ncbi:hypothetical protein [Arthrobacter sp. H35-D1]|uniref:hypothetical protein n=1 Tax=Arthrobacter sp. H35-D1 TaxID=3046202 RepID=UPI0024BB6905|nr:hypothetical protein [Arthrobacter sp. H35-D1]MDJ0313164.1 hypothetical protein [Arthrobacter sp. H35-D1]
MHARSFLPLQGTLLRWGGLLILMLVLVVGLLGMHVIGSGQTAASSAPVYASSAGATEITANMTAVDPAAAIPVAAHSAATPALTASDHVQASAVPDYQGSNAVCGCAPSGCDTSMASHGACIPAAGAATPAAPPPGLVPDPAAGPTETGHAKPKPADLVFNAPSLTQLCISRT